MKVKWKKKRASDLRSVRRSVRSALEACGQVCEAFQKKVMAEFGGARGSEVCGTFGKKQPRTQANVDRHRQTSGPSPVFGRFGLTFS